MPVKDLPRAQTGCRPRSLKIEHLENRLYLSGLPIAGGNPNDFSFPESPSEAGPVQTLVSETVNDTNAIPGTGADYSRAVESINRFAFDLYTHFQQEEGNLFLSPMSIATALAMTYAGADGETATEMADVLHVGSEPGIHGSFRALLESLDPTDDTRPFDLDVANALWPQQGFPFREEFLQLIEAQYGGDAQSLDYASDPEAAREIINAWVEEKTHDKIQDLIPSGALTKLTRMVLTNAIYFKGQWVTEFDPDLTRDRPFYLNSGETIDVPMMYVDSDFRYCEQDGFQVLEMPYEGEDLSMVIVLPQEGTGLDELGGSTLANVDDWLANSSRKQEVIVRLPKFKTTVSSSLNEVLQGMGMPLAFDGRRADFSGMAELNTAERLHVTSVLHKAFVEVNEEGTEAAAATAGIIGIICFAAGTPVLTPEGEKPIEEIRPGDHVLSRDERNVDGAVERKPVEECFEREGVILNLHVAGHVIRTTAEHPFYVQDRGWTAAGELHVGDLLATHNGRWLEVENVVDTGQVETVYNLRVADYHTYFVGGDGWGLWAHNLCGGSLPVQFNADHPFHFFIRDNETGAMLFMGRITDPLAEENSINPKVGEEEGEPTVSRPSWTNPTDPCDVNGKDGVTPLDALVLINHINARPGDTTLPASPPSPPIYYDVNGDGLLTPNDLLQVVRRINATVGAAGGEEPSAGNQGIRVEPTIDITRISGGIFEQSRRINTPSTPSTLDLAVDVQESDAGRTNPGKSVVAYFAQTDVARRNGGQTEDDMHAPLANVDSVLSDIAQDIADVWQSSPA